ncbi:MAG: type III secretion system chaperone [Succinivibrio sp.]|nr:type III secretion system chaperone [Succinivibrio sp.]
MAGITTVVDPEVVRRELFRFGKRIGMTDMPAFDETRALSFGVDGAKLSFELNADGTYLAVSYAVTPEISETDHYLKTALEKTKYSGGFVYSVSFVEPLIIFSTSLPNPSISAEIFEKILFGFIKLWNEVKHGN